MFAVDDQTTIRQYITLLAKNKDSCGINDYHTYQEAIVFLCCYCDFLEEQKYRDTDLQRDLTEDSLTIAYFLAREDTLGVEKLGYKSFREAFKAIGELLHQKPTTLKNMRDEFDPYCSNNRRGWYQRQLSGSRKRVFDKYKDQSTECFYAVVKNILSVYTAAENKTPAAPKRIRISNSEMREIKSKGKI